jgi:hypothetical protein
MGVLNFLLLVWVVRLWTARERIVIGNGTVRVTSGLFGIARTLPLSEVTAIHAVRITSPFLVSVRIRGRAWHTHRRRGAKQMATADGQLAALSKMYWTKSPWNSRRLRGAASGHFSFATSCCPRPISFRYASVRASA